MTLKSPKIVIFTLVSTLSFGTFMAPLAVFGQGGAPDSFEDCAGVPDDIERLACYDEVATEKAPDTIKAMREAKAEQQKREL